MEICINYCNPLLKFAPVCVVKQPQVVQDAVVWAHISPLLMEFHWLPVTAKSKLLTYSSWISSLFCLCYRSSAAFCT